MPQDLFSIDEVAGMLALQARTVRNYVRDGRLKAVRIGKQYRVAGADVEKLTGRPIASPAPVKGLRHVEVSSVVQIDAIGLEAASRVTNTLMAAVKGGDQADQPLRVDTIYDRARGRLKVIVSGSIGASTAVLRLITALSEAEA